MRRPLLRLVALTFREALSLPTGWTVTGSAETITDAYRQDRYCLPLRARPDDRYEQLVRIRPRIGTGYRLVRDVS